MCRCLTAFEAVGISKGLALGIKSFGGFGSRHEGVWSFVDVWDQGEHPKYHYCYNHFTHYCDILILVIVVIIMIYTIIIISVSFIDSIINLDFAIPTDNTICRY